MLTLALSLGLSLGCDQPTETTPPDDAGDGGSADAGDDEPDPEAHAVVLRASKVMTATGTTYSPGVVVFVGDAITYVGDPEQMEVPTKGATIIELGPQDVVTPGIIDTHSHMGVYAAPGMTAGFMPASLTLKSGLGWRMESAYTKRSPLQPRVSVTLTM